MADVKIVDIDGSQWNMKDQETRDRIATLETKTTIKVTKKINEEKLKMNLVEINGEKFIQLHFNGISWDGTIAGVIGNFNNDFGLESIVRCLVEMDFADSSGRDTLEFDIEPSGAIRAYPQTPNQVVGTYKAGNVYGDAFIRMAF